MVRRGLALTLRLFAWLLASVAVLGALAVWRLSAGPLPLTFITPYVEQALTPSDATLRVTLSETQLRLTAERGLQLVALDVKGTGPDGEVLVDLPAVEVGLDPVALFRYGLIAPNELVVRAPEIVLERGAGGSIGLRGQGGPDGARTFELGTLAAPLLSDPDPATPLSFLDAIRIDGARMRLDDQRSGLALRASEGALVLAREPAGVAMRVDLEVDQAGHRIAIDGLARFRRASERITFEVAVDGLRAGDVADLAPFVPERLAGILAAVPTERIEPVFRIEVQSSATLGGDLAPLRFLVRSDGGAVALPDLLARPVQLQELLIRGETAVDGSEIVIADLTLAVNEARVEGQGAVRLTQAGPAIGASLLIADVTAAELDALWPLPAADQARAWVTEHITAGRVPEGAVEIDLQPGDLAQRPLRADAIRGRFRFEDLTIRYFEDLPPATGVSGDAVFDAQTMNFQSGSGRVGELVAASTAVGITGIGIKGRYTTQLEVETVVAGPIPAALELIEHEPFRFASKLGIDPAGASGTANTTLRIGTPLNRDMLEEEVRVDARAVLRDAGLADLFGVASLADGAFELQVTRDAMTLAGRAEVQTVPLQIVWREAFADSAGYDRRIELEGMLDRDALASFGLAEPPMGFQGGAPTTVEVVEQDAVRRVAASLDLTPARLAWPELKWRKPLGEPGTLELDLILQEGAPLAIERFAFRGGGLSADGYGAVQLAPFALQALTLERFRYGEQRGSARVTTSDDGVLQVALDARSLDLRPFLADDAERRESSERPLPLAVEVTADRVLLDDDGEALRSLTGRLVRDRFGWHEVDLEAALPNGARVALDLQPTDSGPRLLITSSDAGELLRTFDRTRRVDGGRFRLQANLFTQVPELQAAGELQITDFQLLDAPVLARLLTVASLTGIGNLLGGEGIFVDRLNVPFTLGDQILTIEDGRLSGSQLGLTGEGRVDLGQEEVDLEGTVVPVYSLNRALGQIPVIGDFLTGGEGEGAFAVTYQVRGPFEEPAVSVNPLSVLAPGVIRELFSGLRDGSLTPPELPPDRD